MSEFVLHCFAQSGNAYKAALMLNLCGADWSPRFIDYFNGETRSDEYRKINEMGEVPVLEHNGGRLTQSGVILDYLSQHFNRFGWSSENERREILRWLLFDNHKLTSYTATLRFMLQFTDTIEEPVIEFLRGRSNTALGILDRHLESGAFVIGERPTIADLSMCGYLFWLDEAGIAPGAFPNIERWLDSIRGLDGWVHPYQLMPGYPLAG